MCLSVLFLHPDELHRMVKMKSTETSEPWFTATQQLRLLADPDAGSATSSGRIQ